MRRIAIVIVSILLTVGAAIPSMADGDYCSEDESKCTTTTENGYTTTTVHEDSTSTVVETTTTTGQQVEIEGFCLVDQSGTARPLFDASFLVGSGTWTVNGTQFGPSVAGGLAVFGVNVWQANPDQGEPTAGEFSIEDCTPPTTTSVAAISELPSTTVAVDPSTTVALAELPFTGIEAWQLAVVGLLVAALGVLLVRGFRAEG